MNEQQVLAQGADEYMNNEQLHFFKSRLLARAEEIKARIVDNQSLCKIDRQADSADTASIEEDREKALRLIDLDNAALKRIGLALQAIAQGEYGYCAETGAPIGIKRLLTVPESLLSVEAMEVLEARGRHQRAAA